MHARSQHEVVVMRTNLPVFPASAERSRSIEQMAEDAGPVEGADRDGEAAKTRV